VCEDKSMLENDHAWQPYHLRRADPGEGSNAERADAD